MNKIVEMIKKFFKGWHEKKIAMTLIGTGSVLAVGSITHSWLESLAVEFLNKQLQTNFDVPENVTIDYIILAVGIFLMCFGVWFYFATREKTKKHTMVQLRHSSIESTNYTKINMDLSDYNTEEYTLNQSEEMKLVNKENLSHALREQEKVVQRTLSRLDGGSDVEFSYLGLAHIPLVFLIGYQMADKSNAIFFEWNQNKLTWNQIEDKKVQFPQFFISKNDDVQESEEAEDIVIKIGITSQILDLDLVGLNMEGFNSYYIFLDPPHRNAIKNTEQLHTYQKEFRELLDEIYRKFPKRKRIHLFYSGQPSLAYRLGSAISPRMDADVWVYNHVSSSYPKYNWAIKLKKIGHSIETRIIESEVNSNV